jgi:hypothetical protein
MVGEEFMRRRSYSKQRYWRFCPAKAGQEELNCYALESLLGLSGWRLRRLSNESSPVAITICTQRAKTSGQHNLKLIFTFQASLR